MDVTPDAEEQVDLANALDLSESEEEEEMETLINDFATQEEEMDLVRYSVLILSPQSDLSHQDSNVRQEKLYFFQFPDPFPTFVPKPTSQPTVDLTDRENGNAEKSGSSSEKGKKVTFAPDVKSASATPTPTPAPETPKSDKVEKLDGLIGRLEIYQSGAVKMRLDNGILLDVSRAQPCVDHFFAKDLFLPLKVTAATQPSFLQHAVHVDMENKRLCVLGEVNRRFIVSPNMDNLIEALEASTRLSPMDVDETKDGEDKK